MKEKLAAMADFCHPALDYHTPENSRICQGREAWRSLFEGTLRKKVEASEIKRAEVPMSGMLAVLCLLLCHDATVLPVIVMVLITIFKAETNVTPLQYRMSLQN